MVKAFNVALVGVFFLAISSNAMASDATSKGIFRGSLRDMYPNATVVNRIILNNAATSGIGKSSPDFFQSTFREFISDFSDYGAKECKSKYYAVDQVEAQYVYNNINNMFMTVIANVVCFELPNSK